jgi:GTP cyclohydrolase I
MKKYEEVIERCKSADTRYWASDNIASLIHDGEREQLIDEAAEAFETVLDTLIIDRHNDPNSKDTARRLAKMYFNEIMSGRYDHVPSVTSFPNDGSYDQLIVIRSDINSMCSHHHQPVQGVCYIACMPGDKVIGLSKYTRLAQHLSMRGHLQEELTEMIACEIEKQTASKSVGVYIRARHGCCENRGIRSSNSATQTTVLKGALKTDSALKNEFMHNIQIQETLGG